MHLRTALPALSLLVASGVLAACGGGDAANEDAPAAESQPSASAPAEGNADIAELQDYDLTMEDLEKWSDANLALQRLAEENPQLAATLESENESASADQSLDAIAERIERVPEAREVIEDAGLDAREYALITFALFQAGMAQYAVEQGQNLEQVARDMQVNPDNIRFMQEHRAEIEQMQAELEAAESGN